MDEFEPRIIGFFCNWCSYRGADAAGTSRAKYPPNVRLIRVMCSGRVDERLILKGFSAGADGILVCGCHPGDCHYQKGNLSARRRVTALSPFLDSVGIGEGRLRLEWISASEGPKVAETVRSFTQTIKGLGPNPMKRNNTQEQPEATRTE
ncbi:MAG: hydrogenase iron-sulfur subunit [Dehalococcoidia bacterium]|nr:hydrogenase iron-sulfur subunit [Dehalococcoidia bacterium]